jgi:hypothetical protein
VRAVVVGPSIWLLICLGMLAISFCNAKKIDPPIGFNIETYVGFPKRKGSLKVEKLENYQNAEIGFA